MRAFRYSLKSFINKGLAPKNNPINNPLLITSIGAYPYNDILQAIEEFTILDTSAISNISFPFPQLLILDECVLVCTATDIYEYLNNTFILRLSGLPVGNLWEVVDFKSFIYLTNGQCAVTRNPTTTVFILDLTKPFGSAVCNYNGQVLLGGPNTGLRINIAATPYIGGYLTGSLSITIPPVGAGAFGDGPFGGDNFGE